MTRRPRVVALVWLALFLSSAEAYAAGYEKAIDFSGHYAGIAGAAAGSIGDSESLYFNPAGLAQAKGREFSLNSSFTFTRFEAPIVIPGVQVTSDRSFIVPFGAFASFELNERLGVGLGLYTPGGLRAVYQNVDFSGLNPAFAPLTPTIESDVKIIEAAAGFGYEIADGLRLGAAYRVLWVSATLDTAIANTTGAPASLTSIQLSGLSQTRWNGFKAGLQYAPKGGGWGLGAAWRSAVGFTLAGTSGGSVITSLGGSPAALSGSDVTVANTFPMQVVFNGFVDLTPNWRFFGEYDFTNYLTNQALSITGSVTLPAALGGTSVPLSSIAQSWVNMSNLRLAFQYTGLSNLTLRGGYVFTSEVVPKDHALPTFSVPGIGTTLVAGAGRKFGALTVDGAFEYSWASGTVSGEQLLSGNFFSNAFVFHLGASCQI